MDRPARRPGGRLLSLVPRRVVPLPPRPPGPSAGAVQGRPEAADAGAAPPPHLSPRGADRPAALHPEARP